MAKKSGPVDSEQLNDAKKELALLTQELDLGPDRADNDENDNDNNEGDEENDDDDDDGSNGENGMTEEELAELQTSLVLIRLMLTKVS